MRIPLLHGFTGSRAAWDATRAAWRGTGELVPVALPGHERPIAPTWDACLDAIDIGDAQVVVGYSMGARLALGLLAAGRIERAVLISVNAGISDAERAARRASDAAWATLLRTQGSAAFADAWQAQPLFASQARVAPPLLAERRVQRLALDPEQLARCLEVMGLGAMPDYRGVVDARCALIVGEDDAKFAAIASSLSAPLEIIPACGHDPTLEQPELLAAAIARRF